MTEKDYYQYWLETAEDAFSTAKDLLKLEHYNYCLFFCHLAIEKLIKGLIFKHTKKHALPIHNLRKLAASAALPLTSTREQELAEITTWNIEARYDNLKREFDKKADKNFTLAWFSKVEKIYLWLKNQY